MPYGATAGFSEPNQNLRPRRVSRKRLFEDLDGLHRLARFVPMIPRNLSLRGYPRDRQNRRDGQEPNKRENTTRHYFWSCYFHSRIPAKSRMSWGALKKRY